MWQESTDAGHVCLALAQPRHAVAGLLPTWELADVYVAPRLRRRGEGARMIGTALAYADAYQAHVMLQAATYTDAQRWGGMTTAKLLAYYTRFGFVRRGESNYMTRLYDARRISNGEVGGGAGVAPVRRPVDTPRPPL